MTSLGSEEIAVQALQAGAASYVPKQRLAQRLADTIYKVLAVADRQRSHFRLMGCMVRASTRSCSERRRLFRPLVTFLQESAITWGWAMRPTARGWAWRGRGAANALYHGNLAMSSC